MRRRWTTVVLHECFLVCSNFLRYCSRTSVCPSVRPSQACFMTKPTNRQRIFWYYTKWQSLCYSDTNSGWRVTPPSVWNLRSKWPITFEKRRLRQISAYNVSTVRDSEKVQLCGIGSRPRSFQGAIDGVRMLSPSRPKGSLKKRFFVSF